MVAVVGLSAALVLVTVLLMVLRLSRARASRASSSRRGGACAGLSSKEVSAQDRPASNEPPEVDASAAGSLDFWLQRARAAKYRWYTSLPACAHELWAEHKTAIELQCSNTSSWII